MALPHLTNGFFVWDERSQLLWPESFTPPFPSRPLQSPLHAPDIAGHAGVLVSHGQCIG
jgi:hypothetical protein